MNGNGSQQPKPWSYSITIAEDNELMREGISAILRREKDFRICGVAKDRKSVLALVDQKEPDIVLLNLFLKGCDGIDLVKDLAARFPETRVIVIGAGSQEFYRERLLHAGASAYLFSFDISASNLVEAIREDSRSKPARPHSKRHATETNLSRLPISSLTDRELYVFRLIGRGVGTGDVARELGLSRKTIEYYREEIKRKLGYRDTAELHRGAFEWAQHTS